MNRNVIIVMAGGFLVAVLVAMIVQATLKPSKKDAAQAKIENIQIIVASRALKAGEELKADNMKWQDWPKTGVFDGLLIKDGNKKITDIAKGKVKRPMAMNEPITTLSLVEKKVNYLAATLSPGMRAVSFKISASTAVAGFVAPGDYVDILLTYRAGYRPSSPGVDTIVNENLRRRVVETILQNVKVIAVDQSPVRNEDKVKVGKTVTVEVNQNDAEILTLATSIGSLDLVLRPLGDDKILRSDGPLVTDERMTNIYEDLVSEIKRRGGSSGQTVRVYSGNSVTNLAVSP